MDPRDAFPELYRVADETRPASGELYIRSKRSVVADLVAEIRIARGQNTKHLLYGATGCGKSTQMRAVAADLVGDMTVVDIDFDASGITVAGISAFDLAYIIGVKALKHVTVEVAEPLFTELAAAYAEEDAGGPSALGRFEEALPGIAGFGDAVLAVAKEVGLAVVPGLAVVSSAKAAMHVLKLRTNRAGLVVETSPRGRRVQSALEVIFDAVRLAHGRPIVVLLDGLEKVNGGANRWMRETFDYTRLLTDVSATMVAATPACAFTQTNSNLAAGWSPQVVYGFAPDDMETLTQVVYRRVTAVGLDLRSSGFATVTPRLVAASGGHPRHAMLLLRYTAMNTLKSGRTAVTDEDVDGAIQRLRELLAMGVIKNGDAVLSEVKRTKQLPDDDVAQTLFGDGRILVHPPTGRARHSFHVHPLLDDWVEVGPSAPSTVSDGA